MGYQGEYEYLCSVAEGICRDSVSPVGIATALVGDVGTLRL